MKRGVKELFLTAGMLGGGAAAALPEHAVDDVGIPQETVILEGGNEGGKSDDFSWRFAEDPDPSLTTGDRAEPREVWEYPLVERRCVEERVGSDYEMFVEESEQRVYDRRFKGSETNMAIFFEKLSPNLRDKIIRLINKHLEIQNKTLPPELKITVEEFLGIIGKESAFNPNIVSPMNACGLCQLMPATAEFAGIKIRPMRKGKQYSPDNNPQLFDIEENIRGGIKTLVYYRKLFVSPDLSILAYNTGNVRVVRLLKEYFPELCLSNGGFDWKKYYQMRREGSVNFLDLYNQVKQAEAETEKTWRSKSMDYVRDTHGWARLVTKAWRPYLSKQEK